MGEYFVAGVNLVAEICCKCHMTFAMPKLFMDQRRKDHKTFFCPDGHSLYYYSESEEERLKKMVREKDNCCVRAQEEAMLAREEAEHQRKRFAGLKGHVAKLKKQAGGE